MQIRPNDIELNTEKLGTVNSSKFIETKFNQIEASSIDTNLNFLKIESYVSETNNFLLMLQLAFDKHKAVSISPDQIWLLICQGLSTCIKEDNSIFQDVFKNQSEKRLVTIVRDDFRIGEENPWEEVLTLFTLGIDKSIEVDLLDKFVLKFTTSTQKEVAAFEIAFLDSMSNYFEYEFQTLCGIPLINILGEKEDYQKIMNSLNYLKDFNLEWWIKDIEFIITEFIETLSGNVDLKFWNSIFKIDNGSGGPYINGWITKLFPLVKMQLVEKDGLILQDKIDILRIEKEIILKGENVKILSAIARNPYLGNETQIKLNFDSFSNGLNVVPFVWKYFNDEFKMNMISGFVGILEKDSCLSTEINWIIKREENTSANRT